MGNITETAGGVAGEITTEVRKKSGIVVLMGILLVIAGTFAMMVPQFTSIVSALFIGWTLVGAGVIECAASLGLGGRERTFVGLVLGALAIIAGILIVMDPVKAWLGLSLALGLYFLVTGAMHLPLAFFMRGSGHSSWLFFGALIDILLGFMILRRWPFDFWILGLLVGVHLIFTGWFWIVAGTTVRGIVPKRAAV